MNVAFHAYIQAAPQDRFMELALAFARDAMRPDASALRRIQTGNHPDFLNIRPDGTSIRIGQVRRCLAELTVRPFEGGRRVVAIHLAEAMTAQAQNCLLKTLEEPPEGTSFLLLCERPSALLPTVQSRCMSLRSATWAEEGGASAAQDLLCDLASEQNVLDVAARLPQEKTALFDRCTALLDGLDTLIRQNAVSRDASLALLGRCAGHVFDAQSMLEHNVNAALCAQWLCIRIKEECYDNRRRSQV